MLNNSHKRAIVFGSYIHSLINFRKNLIEDIILSGHEVLAIAPGYDENVVSILHAMGASFRSVRLARTGVNPLLDFMTLLELRKIFKEYKPTLLITYTVKPVIYGNLAAKYSPGVKTLALITGLGFLDTGERTISKRMVQATIHFLYRVSLRKLDFIAFQNPDDQQYFNMHRLVSTHTDATITAGSGVDLADYRKAEPVTEPVTFLFIARLIRAKGIQQFMDAARQLKPRYGSRVVFQVIGQRDEDNPDSIQESELLQAVAEGIIDYQGFQKNVRPFLAASSVFVLPSYYREGTPRTVLEAMSSAKPIITTDNPGCRETVQEGVNGYLIPVRDSVALARAMENFLEDRKKILDMGEKSYEMARAKYDVRLVNKHLLEFIGVQKK